MNVEINSEIILSIDGSVEKSSLLIARDGRKIAGWRGQSPNSKVEDVLRQTEVLLTANQIEKKQITTVIVSQNESPSTGGKIASAIAGGLARAFGCRLFEIPVFESLLNESRNGADGKYITIIPVGKKNFVQWQIFRKEKDSFTDTETPAGEIFEKQEIGNKLSGIKFEKIICAADSGDLYRSILLMPFIKKELVFLTAKDFAELNFNYYRSASDNVISVRFNK